MANQASRTAFPNSIKAPVDPAQIGDMLTSMLRSQAKVMDSVLQQNIEVLDFFRRRYEKDRKALSSLMTAEDPSVAMNVWSEFWSGAMSDYSEEASKLSALAASTSDQIVEGVAEETRAMARGGAKNAR